MWKAWLGYLLTESQEAEQLGRPSSCGRRDEMCGPGDQRDFTAFVLPFQSPNKMLPRSLIFTRGVETVVHVCWTRNVVWWCSGLPERTGAVWINSARGWLEGVRHVRCRLDFSRQTENHCSSWRCSSACSAFQPEASEDIKRDKTEANFGFVHFSLAWWLCPLRG